MKTLTDKKGAVITCDNFQFQITEDDERVYFQVLEVADNYVIDPVADAHGKPLEITNELTFKKARELSKNLED